MQKRGGKLNFNGIFAEKALRKHIFAFLHSEEVPAMIRLSKRGDEYHDQSSDPGRKADKGS